MKRIISLPLCCLLATFLFNSCIKDEVTKTYTIFTPVYKTRAEVLANIKSNAPQELAKAGKFFLYGKYLLVNEIDKGIHIIDNSNPASPKNIAFIDIPGNVDLAVKSNILYADLYSDLVSIDISNPLEAKMKSVVKNAFPERRYGFGSNIVAEPDRIIVNWTKKDTVVKQSLSNDPVYYCRQCLVMEAANMSFDSKGAAVPAAIAGSMARFSVVNNFLYTVNSTDLNIYSLTDPAAPVFANKFAVGWGIETISPFKGKLFIGANMGMYIYDITDGAAPKRLSMFSHARVCDPVIADDDYAYVTLRSGTNCAGTVTNINQLDVLDISDLNAPVLLKSYQLSNPHGLSKDGQLLFVCDGSEGLKVYDATDVKNLKLIKQIKGFESFDVIAYKNIAMVVEKSGIRQFDYSNPADIKYLSTISW